jgi:phosphate transport system permease protein
MPSAARRARLRKWRYLKDRLSRYGVALGGGGVVVALALIFVYLFIEVAPIFRPASLQVASTYPLPGSAADQTLMLSLERYLEIGARVTDGGQVVFFGAASGAVRTTIDLNLPAAPVTSFGISDPRDDLFAYGLADGTAFVGQLAYRLTYPDDRRHIEPLVQFPLGEAPVEVDPEGATLISVAVQGGRDGYAVAGITEDGRVILARYRVTTSFLTGEQQVRREDHTLPDLPARPSRVLLDRTSRSLFVADTEGGLHYYDISNPAQARRVDAVQVLPPGAHVTAMQFLVGTVSVIIGGSDGSLTQWFLVRQGDGRFALERVRDFEPHGSPVRFVVPEYNRKGFYSGDADGWLGMHYATSERTLFNARVAPTGLARAAVNPLNRGLLLQQDDGTVQFTEMWNEHPQISWSALWGKVHYEGRTEEAYVWQSSSGSDDFESKFSMVPLTVGTLKAAFYAMLFAMPLAIMGAVYSAYFMTPRMRGAVKPTIEVMEALPTVILGFLAGLWLAPFIENHLPAVFTVLILMPLGMLAAALLWTRLPPHWRHAVGPGWEAAILVPVIVGIGWIAVRASPFIELAFFDGSMRQWMTDVGISYDQRNALVVGVAMGFAVIPTIFSIAEDAVFNVPKHLTQGSLALGATPWQTVVGVVLPTASPGIFSAVMIGFGRAVGETMIVLMATGNSPVVNFNIFEGMRTLSANIAVELPETAVGSTHYRILFLAALILFSITFVVNTLAEVVRQRLRKRYASL